MRLRCCGPGKAAVVHAGSVTLLYLVTRYYSMRFPPASEEIEHNSTCQCHTLPEMAPAHLKSRSFKAIEPAILVRNAGNNAG